ncbi:hypothetical protein IL306_010825 [Fusarium sp. DS 682]|nr:hypothetical protein IL306_010825 [Fusarium sp. DS 682]
MEDTSDSQKISLCHKSVKDFFVDPKNKERIEEYLPEFFIDELKALEELGVNCIEYLSDERYQSPSDLRTLVTKNTSSYDNAFLRYAAVFWHMHMRDIKPSSDTLKVVEDFLKSPAFWTCIYVQSHAAPHLFARYRQETSQYYLPMMGIVRDATLQFGLPLPSWKEEFSSADYMSLDRSFCAFVLDWGELLAKNPDQLHHAVPLTLYKSSCHLKAPSGLQKVHIKYVSKLLEPATGMRILDSSFSSTSKKRGSRALQLRIIHEHGAVPNRQIKVNQVDVFSRTKSDQVKEPMFESEAPGIEWITTIARDNKQGQTILQGWRVERHDMSITRRRQGDTSQDQTDQPPPEVRRELNLDQDEGEHWNLVQLDIVTQPNRKDTDSVTRLFHFRKGYCAIHSHDGTKTQKGMNNSTSSSGDSSSDSDGDSDWSMDLDDASDSSDTHSINDGKDANLRTRNNCDGEPNEPFTDCLIVASDFGKPVWRPIQINHLAWSRLIGTRHPVLPMVAVSHKLGQVEIMNDQSGIEVQFSPCGSYLTLLSVSFYQREVFAECHVAVSCFKFVQSPAGYSFQACKDGPFAAFSYSFLGKVDELPRPYIMTNWTAEHLTLALPPLTYSPKIIRISLTSSKNQEDLPSRISTLTYPIFLPQSTISRSPHIMYCDGGSPEKDSYLYLVLDTPEPSLCPDSTLRCGPGHFRRSECAVHTFNDKRSEMSAPVVMGWRMLGSGKARKTEDDANEGDESQEKYAWRDWNDEDQVSEDVLAKRSAADVYQM